MGYVFSPRYRRARLRGAKRGELPDPIAFSGVNLAIYSPHRRERAWAMSEYAAHHVTRDAQSLQIGANRIELQHGQGAGTGDRATWRFDERSPWTRRRLRGELEIDLPATRAPIFDIDVHGRHQWTPIAPRTPVRVRFERPALEFEGIAYHDANRGSEGLEAAFDDWDWSRADFGDHARIVYDTRSVEGEHRRLALRIDEEGTRPVAMQGCPERALPTTRWGLPPFMRVEVERKLELSMMLEDTPFYSRSLLDLSEGAGEAPIHAVHEHLDMGRFVRPSTQLMLPFRTRRVR